MNLNWVHFQELQVNYVTRQDWHKKLVHRAPGSVRADTPRSLETVGEYLSSKPKLNLYFKIQRHFNIRTNVCFKSNLSLKTFPKILCVFLVFRQNFFFLSTYFDYLFLQFIHSFVFYDKTTKIYCFYTYLSTAHWRLEILNKCFSDILYHRQRLELSRRSIYRTEKHTLKEQKKLICFSHIFHRKKTEIIFNFN